MNKDKTWIEVKNHKMNLVFNKNGNNKLPLHITFYPSLTITNYCTNTVSLEYVCVKSNNEEKVYLIIYNYYILNSFH